MDLLSINLKAIDEGLDNLVRLSQNLNNLDDYLKTFDPVIKNIEAVETALGNNPQLQKEIRKVVSEPGST